MTQRSTSAASWPLVALATAAMAISYIDRQTLALTAPLIEREFGITHVQYGWLAGAFSITYLLAAPIAGAMLDKVGTARGMLWSLSAWSLVCGLHSACGGFIAFLIARLALGAAEAGGYPAAARTVYQALPAPARGRGLGILLTGSSIGAMLAPAMVSLSSRHFGWRGAFVFTALLGAVWGPLWWRTASRAAPAQASDSSGDEQRSGHWLVLRPLLATTGVRRAILGVLAVSPITAFLLLWAAKLLAELYGVPAENVGKYLWLPPLLFDLGAIFFGDLIGRSSIRNSSSLRRAALAVAVVLSSSVCLVAKASSAWAVCAFAGVAMFGAAGILTMVTVRMLGEIGSDAVSRATGVTSAVQSLVYIAVNPLIGVVVKSAGYSTVLWALASWALVFGAFAVSYGAGAGQALRPRHLALDD